MQDPAQAVDPRLIHHLHLLILAGLPKTHTLHLNDVVNWLQRAPTLSRERPVTFQFISPQDPGTLMLEYIHPSHADRCPSDGYAWLDSERAWEKEVPGGFVLDIYVHQIGFVPQRENLGVFTRTRYRIRPAAGQTGAGPFDPSFWLVHYKHADHATAKQLPHIPIPPHVHQILSERHALSQIGVPQRKEFMLADRSAWPSIPYPTVTRKGAPPAKRARQSGPQHTAGAMPAPPGVLHHYDELELLEDTSAGDYLDNIAPATVSRDRFKRHHQWFEQVFSSLYGMNHVEPEDMGFGLVGELGELTKGLLNEPVRKPLTREERETPAIYHAYLQDPQINAPTPYKKLDAEQYQEFEKRVTAFVETKNKEMDDMREKHAKIMSRINKGRYYLDAEEKLREAGLDATKADEIVRDVEQKMGISLQDRKDVVLVQRGALEDEKEEVNGTSSNGVNGHSSDDQTGGLLDDLDRERSANDADGMDLDLPQADSHPAAAATSASATPALALGSTPQGVGDEAKTPGGLDAGGSNDVVQPESMFDGAEFSAFDGIENDGLGGGGYDGNADNGLLDFDGSFGDGGHQTGGS